ncbi:putative ankyrin repeat protein L88 [Paramyrothecium foliicola]|nr:putative ankyrin repeat protein L88 [Paramyrothecium foliicola]
MVISKHLCEVDETYEDANAEPNDVLDRHVHICLQFINILRESDEKAKAPPRVQLLQFHTLHKRENPQGKQVIQPTSPCAQAFLEYPDFIDDLSGPGPPRVHFAITSKEERQRWLDAGKDVAKSQDAATSEADLGLEPFAYASQTCQHVKEVTEEVLYRNDVDLPHNRGAAMWAARHNSLSTLDKALRHNRHTDVAAVYNMVHPDGTGEFESKYRFDVEKFWNSRDDDVPHSWTDATALHLAAFLGHDNIVNRLLDEGDDLEKRAAYSGHFPGGGPMQVTPLFLALIGRRASTALNLLKRGAQHAVSFWNGTDDFHSALHFAVLSNLESVVEELLTTYDADVSWGLSDERLLPIHMAALNSPSLDLIPRLINAGSPVNSQVEIGFLGDHPAIFGLLFWLEDEEAVEKAFDIIVATGTPLNLRNNERWTLLQYAARYRLPSMVKLLLQHGLDPNDSEIDGQTPLEILCAYHDPTTTYFEVPERGIQAHACVRHLLEGGAIVRRKLVKDFVSERQAALAELIFPYMIDPPKSEGYWLKALWEVAGLDRAAGINCIAFLIGHCPPRTGKNMQSEWMKLIFRLFGTSDIDHDYVIHLVEQNLSIGRFKTTEGCNSLMRLLRNPSYSHERHSRIRQGLIKGEPDINVTDRYGNTYLHHLVDNWALNQDNFKIALGWLIQRGLDANQPNHEGQTALHIAAINCRKYIREKSWSQFDRESLRIGTLIERGANRTLSNMNGNTPLVILQDGDSYFDTYGTLVMETSGIACRAVGQFVLSDQAARDLQRTPFDGQSPRQTSRIGFTFIDEALLEGDVEIISDEEGNRTDAINHLIELLTVRDD